MNVFYTLVTTSLLALGIGLGTAGSAEPTPAMAAVGSLSIADLDHSVVTHGGGLFTAQLHGHGTLSGMGPSVSTSFDLTCEVDDSAESLECTGVLRVGGVAAPLRLRSIAGEARYAISNGFSAKHMAAWERWHNLAIVDVVPPFDSGDDAGEGDDGVDGGGDGGWNFPGDIEILDNWTVRDYSSDDWTTIMDGVVMDALDW